MQVIFQTWWKNGERMGIDFIPNYGILPDYIEIDLIIGRLQKLKMEMTDEEIKEHNSKAEDEQISSYSRVLQKEKSKRNIQDGYIYVIKSGEYYKIGRTVCLKDRIKKYITENPNEVKVLLNEKVVDYVDVEDKLLKMFKKKKHRGEWFKLDNSDIDIIKNYLKENETKT